MHFLASNTVAFYITNYSPSSKEKFLDKNVSNIVLNKFFLFFTLSKVISKCGTLHRPKHDKNYEVLWKKKLLLEADTVYKY